MKEFNNKVHETIKEINQAPTQPKKVGRSVSAFNKDEQNNCVCDYAQSSSKNDQRKDTWHCSDCNKDWYLGKELITLKGHTTSQINQALKTDNPYPARVFLKTNENKEDIPVFFRIKETCQFHSRCSQDCRYKSWIKPKIKKGSYLQVEGKFDNPVNGNSRKSFTAYSYQILNQEAQQEILSHEK